MIYHTATVIEDTTVYGFAYKFFNHDTNRLFTAVPTKGVVKNHRFYSDKDGFDPDNQFDGSEPDSTLHIFLSMLILFKRLQSHIMIWSVIEWNGLVIY